MFGYYDTIWIWICFNPNDLESLTHSCIDFQGIEAAFLVVIGGVYLLLSVAYLGPHVSLDAFKEESEDIVVEHRFAAALAAAHVLCALLSVCVTTIAYQAYKRQKREDKQVLKNYDSVKAAF